MYDCGALSLYTDDLKNEIQSFWKSKEPKRLNYLILSHLHDDHVNGIPGLIKDATIDTIMMPAINVFERLIVFAMALVNGVRPSAFFRDLIINPVAAMTRFSPRRIITVIASNAADNGVTGDVENSYARQVVDQDIQGEELPKRRRFRKVEWLEISDLSWIEVFLGTHCWTLKPYVHKGAPNQTLFIKKLMAGLNLTAKELERKIDTSEGIKELMSRTEELRAAYKAVHADLNPDLNLSSLCLYSGPKQIDPDSYNPIEFKLLNLLREKSTSHVARLSNGILRNMSGSCGWIGTGDAKLVDPIAIDLLIRHFLDDIHDVATMTVPHHGSAYSSSGQLYNSVCPALCVVAADKWNQWQHPAASVTRDIANASAQFAVVTRTPSTRLVEEVFIKDYLDSSARRLMSQSMH